MNILIKQKFRSRFQIAYGLVFDYEVSGLKINGDFGDFRQFGRFLGILRNFGQISDNGSDFYRNFGHLATMGAIFTKNSDT